MHFVDVLVSIYRYPGKSREDFENACPFCCGNCNCKACLREFLVKVGFLFNCISLHCESKAVNFCLLMVLLLWQPCREVDPSVKLQRLRYLLYKALPVLRHIYSEQSSELEIEAKIRGYLL